MNVALNDLSLDVSVENEIRDAVNQGRIAITHQSNIQVPGWSGSGYLILDSQTLLGSYKISGGGNGADYVAPVLGVIDGYYGKKLEEIKFREFADTKAAKQLRNLLRASLVGALVLFGVGVYNTVLDDDIPSVLKVPFIAIDIIAAVLVGGLTAAIVGGGGSFLAAGLAVGFAVFAAAYIVNFLKLWIVDLFAAYYFNNGFRKVSKRLIA